VDGNNDLQAVLTFTPLGIDSFNASYSGDVNYPAASGNLQGGPIEVTGSDFALTPVQPSITAFLGQQIAVNYFVDLQSNTAPVTFGAMACSGLPAQATCTTNAGSVSSTTQISFTITTNSVRRE
jgi:hypothetical protein